MLYGGRWISADDLPVTYLPTMLALQLPELVLAGLGTGRLVRRRRWSVRR